MLTDPREIEIISKAQQVNVRDPRRSRAHFERIFEKFLTGIDFSGGHYLDMGPGQYDFGMMVRERGGKTIGIDNDPAVLELGQYKGFEVVDLDLRNLANWKRPMPLDGIFCKFSISAFWFETVAQHQKLSETLVGMLKPHGWLWIAPWNGAYDAMPESDVDALLRAQIDAFASAGCSAWELSPDATRHFGVHGKVANNVVFTRNTAIPGDPTIIRSIKPDTPRGNGAAWSKPVAPSGAIWSRMLASWSKSSER